MTSGSNAPDASEITFRKEVERNLNVCPQVRRIIFALTVEQRLSITVDRGTWRELFAELRSRRPAGVRRFANPIRKRIEQARAHSGRNDAVVTGIGKIEDASAAIARDGLQLHGRQHGRGGRREDCPADGSRAGKRGLPVVVFFARAARGCRKACSR